MKKLDDNDEFVILGSGACPFCDEPIHIVCEMENLSKSAKIVDGKVTAILCKTFAHPQPWCPKFDLAVKRGKSSPTSFYKWLKKKANIQIDPTPIDEALN